MTRLRSLAPMVRATDTSTARIPPKQTDPHYLTPEHRTWREEVLARAGGRCEAVDHHGHRCSRAWPKHRMVADHIHELHDGGSLLDPNNGQCLCASHHNSKTFAAKKARNNSNLFHPALPRPTCRVKLICGPPAAGKSTFVRDNAKVQDIVIDLDTIAREYGFDRAGSAHVLPLLLQKRNNRLAQLAGEPAERTAWVILGAPGLKQRQWWRDALGVQAQDLVVLAPSRGELYRRVVNDPDRKDVIDKHLMAIDRWFKQEIGAWPL